MCRSLLFVNKCLNWLSLGKKTLFGFVTDWLEIYWVDQSQRRLSIPLPSMRFINKIYFLCQTDTDLISNDKMFALLSCNGKYMKNYINCEDLCKSLKWCIIASKANFPTQITEHTVIDGNTLHKHYMIFKHKIMISTNSSKIS